MGFFHPWLHLLKTSWKFWKHCTSFLFQIVFTKAKWFEAPKTAHILTFYQTLSYHRLEIMELLKDLIFKHSNISFYQSLMDFIAHIIPFIFTYKVALKQKNFKFLLTLQPKLWILLTFCGNINYSRAVLFQNFLFYYWKSNNHLLSKLLYTVPNFFNEEIGEISLSTVARSTHNTSQQWKTLKLKENFPLISKVRQAADFFGVKMPFKHAQPKNVFFQKNTITGQILMLNLKANLQKILNTSLTTEGKLKFIKL